jgi:DNA-binding response OmpR family regulator
MKNILLVEDGEEIYMLVRSILSPIANVTWASSFVEGRIAIKKDYFDLYLLDVELPDGSGVDLCSEINSQNPLASIFFLSAHDNLLDKVLGFSAGANDYITKPFLPLELKARVESSFRKSEKKQDNDFNFNWLELEVHALTQDVIVKSSNNQTHPALTALEFKLLMYFSNRVNEVISRDKILDDLWGKNIHVYPRSVDTHVSKLRKKLGGASGVISSIHGTGYKFHPTPL